MAFEDFRMGVAMLLDEIAENPHDVHELQESLREKLAEMQALGLPLPDDLVGLEEYLEEDLEATARRRRPRPTGSSRTTSGPARSATASRRRRSAPTR